eukprot:TRINITY_DN2849_c0_g1_i1.p1 TRINITY_DN2849_c0_g1~~TRINITY_DN2849_c0_g1_i1.p1  ORF type:complete len:1432 (+),score=415.42 TRINITY_DN2849_c0_g1_i1:66-4361(+)
MARLALLCMCACASASPFDTLNRILAHTHLRMPPALLVSDSYLGQKATVNLTKGGELAAASFKDIILTHEKNNASIDVTVTISKLSATVAGDMDVKVGPVIPLSFQGDTDMTITADSLNFMLRLDDMNASHPPRRLTVDKTLCSMTKPALTLSCSAAACDTINLATKFKPSMIQDEICEKLKIGLESTGTVALTNISNFIAAYMHDVPAPEPAASIERRDEDRLAPLANMNNSLFMTTAAVLLDYLGTNGDAADELAVNQLVPEKIPVNITQNVTINSTNIGTLRVDAMVDLGGFAITQLDLLHLLANRTVRSEFAFRGLNASAGVDISLMIPDTLVVGGANVTLGLGASVGGLDVGAGLHTTAGINVTQVADYHLGSLLSRNATDILDCLLTPVKLLNVSWLNVSMALDDLSVAVTNITDNAAGVTGVPSSGIDALLQAVLALIADGFGDYLTRAVPYAAYQMGTSENVTAKVEDVDTCKWPPQDATVSGEDDSLLRSAVIDVASWPPLKLVRGALQASLEQVDSALGVNRLIRKALPHITDNWNGTVYRNDAVHCVTQDPVVQAGYPGNVSMGTLKACLANVTVTGVDHFAELALIGASEYSGDPFPTVLTNRIATRGAPLEVGLDFQLDWTGPGDDMHDHAHLGLAISGADMGADVRALLLHDKLFDLKIRDVVSGACLLPALKLPEGLKFPHLQLTHEAVAAKLHCYECTSPVLDGFGKNLEDRPHSVTEFANNFTDFLFGPLMDEPVQQLIDDTQRAAKCGEPLPSPPLAQYEIVPGSGGVTLRAIIIVGLVGGTFLALVMYTVYGVHQALNGATGESRPLVGVATPAEGETLYERLQMGESIWGHHAISNTVRVAVLFSMAVVVAALLVSIFAFDGMRVMNTFTIAGQERSVVMYHYTSLGFGKDGWDSGETTLQIMAFGTLLASGAWSWVKVLILLWALFVPPTVLSHKHRTTLLIVQDFLAKWSMLDVFINLLLIVFTDVHIEPSDEVVEVWKTGLFAYDLHIELRAGFYIFAISQIINQIVGQVLLFNNRNLVASVKKQQREREELAVNLGRRRQDSQGKSPVFEYYNASKKSRSRQCSAMSDGHDPGLVSPSSFRSIRSYATTTWFQEGAAEEHREALRDHLYGGWMRRLTCFAQRVDNKVRLNLVARTLVFFCIVAAIVCFLYGFSQSFIAIDSEGLFGKMMWWTKEPETLITRNFNLPSMLDYLYTRSMDTIHHVLNVVVVLLLLLCCLVLPVFLMCILMTMWFVPMTLRTQKQLYFMSEICASWSAPELLVVALALLTPATRDLTLFIQGNRTAAINDALAELTKLGWADLEHNMMSWNEARYMPAFFALLVGAVLYNLVYVVIHQANRAAIRYREKKAYDAWYLRRKLEDVAEELSVESSSPRSACLEGDDDIVDMAKAGEATTLPEPAALPLEEEY